MSLAVATLWTLLRALAITPIATAAAALFEPVLTRSNPTVRRIAWGLITGIILIPDWLIAYGYANFGLSLLTRPLWNEVLGGALIAIKASALAAAVLAVSPASGISAAGVHVASLSKGSARFGIRSMMEHLGIVIRGPVGRLLAPGAIAFIWTFQQYDIPSLMGLVSWSVTLFEQWSLRGPTVSVWSLMTAPVLVEFAILLPLMFWLAQISSARDDFADAIAGDSKFQGSRHRPILAWSLLGIGVIAMAIPVALTIIESTAALPAAIKDSSLYTRFIVDIFETLALSLIAAVVAFAIVQLLNFAPRGWGRVASVTSLSALCGVALMGSLSLSIVLAELFRSSALRGFYDTIVPLVVAWAVWLLPRAVLLQLVINATARRSSIREASLALAAPDRSVRARARRLLWELRSRPKFMVIGLLAWWAYSDVNAAAVLAPVSVVSPAVRLYNFMHYGHNASLSLRAALCVAIPLLIYFLVDFLTPRLLARLRR
ncbi:hypothetical protein [Stratiformator vulcanicus]|uniref:ABC transmembrane type-1 domain-containing protein n=1 Tax=Stratiformator vulcanicus TaxID=2527980 RepID=A0A517R0B7_9PLAN|nr:hypothetical protein [Stratiformator vulcanicus]QDT37346.1 hypothetical protein Pan189_17190 [Stratiformator vulcanicus]